MDKLTVEQRHWNHARLYTSSPVHGEYQLAEAFARFERDLLASLTPPVADTPTGDPNYRRRGSDATEALRAAARKRVLSYVFGAAQPDRGDVFGWIDDHIDEIILAALKADKP